MTYTLVIKNAQLVLPHTIQRGALAIIGDRIDAIIPDDASVPVCDNVIDVDGAFVAPGFVDLHIHGAAGVDFMYAGFDELARLAGWLASRGVTRFVPTLVPSTDQVYRSAVARISDWVGRSFVEEPRGAIPLGIHFEGPFLSASRCGALRSVLFRAASDLDHLFDVVGTERLEGLPTRLMTVSPEIPGGCELVAELVSRGFIVSMGHTEADADALDKAFEAGARHMTHFMNAMPLMHHRRPGPVGWGLLKRGLTVDVIADLRHLHPETLKLVVGARTSTRVALISDSVPPAGLGDGTFDVWGEPVHVVDGSVVNADGHLTGSTITVVDAVRNMVGLGYRLVDAVRMATAVPARVLGVESLGSIAAGRIADLVAFRDEIEPFLTIVAGRVVLNYEQA